MVHLSFRGAHPAARKGNTRRKPLTPLEQVPEQVFLPLDMCSAAPSVPVVEPGEPVLLGQVIARGEKEDAVDIHASVSGRVADIKEYPHPWGGTARTIVLTNDGKDTPVDCQPGPIDPAHIVPETLIRRVREAGIVGMGGDARPTHRKLAQAMGRVDTLIVNAVECEPYVTADQRLLMDRGDLILQGALILCQVLRAKRVVLAQEGDQLGVVERLERVVRREHSSVELLALRTRYPLGAEKQLVQAVTGREVPPGGSAVDVGCVVMNVATVYAVSEALILGRPLTHRAVTIGGGAVVRPRNLWVPIGTPFHHLLKAADGTREPISLALTGGPMMGVAQTDLDAPVVKDTNGLICLAARERSMGGQEGVCVRCGHCVDSCPMRLAPAFVYRAIRRNQPDRLPGLHTEDCLECGCCTYVCPSHIPLLDLMRQAKAMARGGEAR